MRSHGAPSPFRDIEEPRRRWHRRDVGSSPAPATFSLSDCIKLLSKNMGTVSFPSQVLEKVSVRCLAGCVAQDRSSRGSHVLPESTVGTFVKAPVPPRHPQWQVRAERGRGNGEGSSKDCDFMKSELPGNTAGVTTAWSVQELFCGPSPPGAPAKRVS